MEKPNQRVGGATEKLPAQQTSSTSQVPVNNRAEILARAREAKRLKHLQKQQGNYSQDAKRDTDGGTHDDQSGLDVDQPPVDADTVDHVSDTDDDGDGDVDDNSLPRHVPVRQAKRRREEEYEDTGRSPKRRRHSATPVETTWGATIGNTVRDKTGDFLRMLVATGVVSFFYVLVGEGSKFFNRPKVDKVDKEYTEWLK